MDIQDIIKFVEEMDKTDESYYQLYLLLLQNANLHNLDHDCVLIQS